MPETQGTDQQSRDDLVANAEHRHAFEHGMAERHSSRQRNRVAAEQAQLHACLPLRDAVAHCRNAASDLGGRADFASRNLDGFGVAAIRLMRRQHVVIGCYDAEVDGFALFDRCLVFAGRRKSMRKIAARQGRAVGARFALLVHQRQVSRTCRLRPLDDPICDGVDNRMQFSHAMRLRRVRSCQ